MGKIQQRSQNGNTLHKENQEAGHIRLPSKKISILFRSRNEQKYECEREAISFTGSAALDSIHDLVKKSWAKQVEAGVI